MATMMMALPIRAGQTEALRAFAQECMGPRSAANDAAKRRLRISAENWYLLSCPDGGRFMLQIESPDLMSSLSAFIASTEPFVVWYKEQVRACTGYDFNAGPPPPEMLAESLVEYKAV